MSSLVTTCVPGEIGTPSEIARFRERILSEEIRITSTEGPMNIRWGDSCEISAAKCEFSLRNPYPG